ncbi:cytochrome c-type biogenesis protein CcsB [Apibacter mensalis]|uniref:Cytochrome c-type biogenesis protein CcsB n=1 Tax=Apibacter mensalis TaxID=1586267 RepID=A0A0X3AR91_9FLAO|nr:c-type cytochrome biogenesis protein CcsB [Apibacter mensalis]CVK16854.1 cytochrome c-type biogenesis protein CcsB [Apibacter mensalis]
MKKILNLLFSTKTTAIMLGIYALTMAWATLVENDYGTSVAKALIYNSEWFELIMIILVLNFIGNIKKYNLWSLKKWPILVFHVSFILIFIGGAITRYISFEGQMHIREGNASNEIISDATYFKVQISDYNGETRVYKDIPFTLTSENIPTILKPFQKKFSATYDFLGKKVKLESLKFIPRAQDSIQLSHSGKRILKVIYSGKGGRETIYIEEGTARQVQNSTISFNNYLPEAINITTDKEETFISSPMMGKRMIMTTRDEISVEGNQKKQVLHFASLYQFPHVSFVIPTPPQSGKIIYYEGDKNKNSDDPDLIYMKASTNHESKEFLFYGKKGLTGVQKQVTLDNLIISLGYGSKIYTTSPFYLKLNKFIMEHYPGSNSPSSYESDIVILDDGKETPFKIYMNHVLNYKGYRFFQSSFDSDLKGTILSVNHDFWGTTLTYIGYALLIVGMFMTLFWKGTRFSKLNKQLKKIAAHKKLSILLLFIFFSQYAFTQNLEKNNKDRIKINKQIHDTDRDKNSNSKLIYKQEHSPSYNSTYSQEYEGESFSKSIVIPKSHSDKFGKLLVQSSEGRIEPINTLALEVLRKLYKSEKFYDLDANQFFISISINPMIWANVPLIKIGNRGGDQLKKLTRANKKGYTSLMNLFTTQPDGSPDFILANDFKKAFRKKTSERTNYDKEIIELNDKLQVMQGLISGQYLKLIPIPNDNNHTWTSWVSPDLKTDSTALKLIGGYFRAVVISEKDRNWNKADVALKKISDYQVKWGKNIIPPQAKIDWEIRYNHWNIFFKIMIGYALLGLLLLVLAFTKLFTDKYKLYSWSECILLGFVILIALLHGVGLAVRWYISGHEPWSNGYEAVLFISWISVLAGFLLYRNRNGFIPAAGCWVAVILMGFAHGGDQMNPQITPLVPVLKSYWLMIHVAVITSSYGFFGLSALIGVVVLFLFIINHKNIFHKVENSIKELTIVNEISLTIGIFLLTVGTFLGGIWANESWGRYWSWDPKETWAFISVIVYAIVLHLRLVPSWRGKYLFNFLSLIAFSTIVMTYFGVNYYLSGLHSYAQGDPVPIPIWVYIVILLVILLGVISFFSQKRKFHS